MNANQALDILRGIFCDLSFAYHDPDWYILLTNSLTDETGMQRINRLKDAITYLDTQQEALT